MKIAIGIVVGILVGVTGCAAWFAWFFKDTFR